MSLTDSNAQPNGQSLSKRPLDVSANLRIGDLLVKEGFVKQEDIQRALTIQKEEAELAKYPLGQILVRMGAIQEEDLQGLLNHPELKRDLGSLAIEKGYITRTQLAEALRKQTPGQPLGDLLVKEGYLSPEQLQDLQKEQMNSKRLGELAVQKNLIDEKTLQHALKIQKSPRVLGEILCDLELVSPLDLYYVLNKYKKQFKLGEILIRLGYIDKETLNQALREQRHSSESLGEILVRKQLITNEQLQEALSRQCNIPFRNLRGFAYSEEDKKVLSGIISRKYAEKNLMIPISLIGKDLTLAIVRPENIHTARELKGLYSNLNIKCVLITEEKFSELFEVLYSAKLGRFQTKVDQEEQEEEESPKGIDFMQIELDEDMDSDADEGPVYDAQDIEAEELVNFIIKYGISNGASDIHIEQDREGAKLRYRIDGVLQDVNISWLKKKLQEKAGSIISRIKIISNLDIAERRLPQDGVFRINYYDKARGQKYDLDFRVATCRAIAGENVTIRILDSRKANVGLESLNHSPHVLEPFKRFLKSSAGMILVSGPTGSGKSSTLYAALKYIYDPGIKIITAEDPIEYSFPGIMQTQVNPKIDLTFSRLLRSFLRLDPDVILVGEIRDEETAKIGFDAAQTGHLLLSTVHTNDSVSAVPRLMDLNVERAQIAASLSCVLAQRLVRRICPSCIMEIVPDEKEWAIIFDEYPSHLQFYKGKGCEACGYTGYQGRTLLSEIFVVDKDIASALSKGAEVDDIKVIAMEKGMLTMLDDGLMKLRLTTLSEIIRVVPHDMIQTFRMRERQRRMREEELPEGAQQFMLTDVRAQSDVINGIYDAYEKLISTNGGKGRRVDRPIFVEFIKESFEKICREHNCSKVSFILEKNHDGVEISALPEFDSMQKFQAIT